jgi:hypothetical protein
MPPDASCGALPQTACCWAPPNAPTSRDHRPGTSGRTRGSTAPGWPGWSPQIWRKRPGVPGCGCAGTRPVPALDADLTFSPAGGADHGPRGGRGIPAAWPGGSRAGPGHGALPRRGDYLQLHRPARLRPHPSGRHSGSGRPHATCLPAGAHHRPGYVQATGSPGRTPPAAPPGQRSRARGTLAGGMRSRGGVDWLLTREPQADAE